MTAVALALQIVPRLREIRGDRALRELEQETGLHRGTLSQLERGERLPRPADLDGLERGYGPRRRWYEVRGRDPPDHVWGDGTAVPRQRNIRCDRDAGCADVEPREGNGALRRMIIAFACTTSLLMFHQTAQAAGPLDRIRAAQQHTHDCERQLGLAPTPVSARVPRGGRYRRWVLSLWETRARIVCGLVDAANRDPRVAIRVTFGPKRYQEASRVAWCESRYDTTAENGQYLGTWQMGEDERATYGHGDTPLEQGLAARRYFDVAGWHPWECARLTGVI